jgi:hypothetical protein
MWLKDRLMCVYIYYFRRSGDGGGHEAQVQREDREARRGDEAQVHADQDTQGGAQVAGVVDPHSCQCVSGSGSSFLSLCGAGSRESIHAYSGSGYPRRRSGSRFCGSAFVSMRIRIQLFISVRIWIIGVVGHHHACGQCSGSAFVLMQIRIQIFFSMRIRILGAKPVWIRILVRLYKSQKILIIS